MLRCYAHNDVIVLECCNDLTDYTLLYCRLLISETTKFKAALLPTSSQNHVEVSMFYVADNHTILVT